ncbi:MAG: low molecular weight phosphotyrosine protein phosphatase [Nitrosomonas sp.]|nr:MAG: low molecular weight phosphotyrosine protein phosphatase [Nitrosomonas sp.]
MPKILFVCLGNICRSPAAAGILADLIKDHPADKDFVIDSCAIGDWHIGEKVDSRMQAAALSRGVVLPGRAKLFMSSYFDDFDYIFAVDQSVLHELHHLAKTPQHKAKVHLFTAFSLGYHNQDVPDPYYGGDSGFELVLDIIEDACEGFLQHLSSKKEDF